MKQKKYILLFTLIFSFLMQNTAFADRKQKTILHDVAFAERKISQNKYASSNDPRAKLAFAEQRLSLSPTDQDAMKALRSLREDKTMPSDGWVLLARLEKKQGDETAAKTAMKICKSLSRKEKLRKRCRF